MRHGSSRKESVVGRRGCDNKRVQAQMSSCLGTARTAGGGARRASRCDGDFLATDCSDCKHGEL